MFQEKKIFDLRLATAFGAAAMLSLPAFGMTITDGFGDGDRDNDGTPEGVVADASDTGFTWLIANGSSSSSSPTIGVTDDTAGIGTGNALSFDAGSTSTRRLFAGYDTIELSSPGEFISLTFQVRFAGGVAPTTDGDFRFGLYNEGAVKTENDFDGNSSVDSLDDESGYYVTFDTGTPGSGTLAAVIVEPNVDGSPLTGSSSSGDSLSFGGSVNAGNLATNGLLPADAVLGDGTNTVSLKITYNDVDDLNFLLTLNGNVLRDRDLLDDTTDPPGPSTFAFDSLLIASSGTDLSFTLDNVAIETNIPEPGSLSLAALGTLALLRRATRRG
ncbi:MAG: PEP-CTERM sorting domain-containing protein [Planctomycetota bacterium]